MPRNGLAALDRTTGGATSWNPNAGLYGPNASVGTLAVSGQTVYAAGAFNSIGGQARNNIAALDRTTGAATSWNPDANDVVDALAFGPDGSLWVGGRFRGFATVPQSGIARFKP